MGQVTWFDSHCHLDLPEFDGGRDGLWRAASAAGVVGVLVPGLEPSQWPAAQACAEQFGAESAWAAGLHPWWLARQADGLTPEVLVERLAHWVQQPGCVAIGECGLDGVIDFPIERQIRWLEGQLALALEQKKPVILHQVKAHNPLIQLLNRYSGLRGIVHGFSGSLAMAHEYIDRGFLLGIGGVITYPRATKTRATVAALPEHSFLLETDAPSMPLHGQQGKHNVPENLVTVAKAVAELRGESLAQLAATMAANYARLFVG